MGKFSRLGNDLYNGHHSIDFIGKRALWYAISGTIVGAAILVVVLKGLNFGIEFTGGTEYKLNELTSSQAGQTTADDLRSRVGDLGIEEAANPTVTTVNDDSLVVQIEGVSPEDSDRIEATILDVVGVDKDHLSQGDVSASWGREVAQRAGLGVTVFLILVVLFIWGYFREWKMSVAALVALFHDIAITVGVYSLSGFSVTPAAVTGLLAILGFSLYDTVVVFDKVRENTHELRQKQTTYAHAANLAVNQTLVRSINTGLVALIPIGSILYVSAVQLGSSSLKDLALSQFVGMAAGVFSSVWVAPRVLVHLKSSESEVLLAEKRAKARAKAQVDRYASVPTFRDDMPLYDEKTGRTTATRTVTTEAGDDTPARTAPPRRDEAAGSGRVVPEATRPVKQSGSSKRSQPERQSRSKRGRK
jgi:preprotein translocase subunit SecF